MTPLLPSSPTGTLSRSTSQSSQKKPISEDKLPRARELYEKVETEWRKLQESERRKLQFEQNLQELPSQAIIAHEHDGQFLNVPTTPLRSRSRSSSRSSRASATSSTDIREDLSGMTSVLSFDDSVEHRERRRNPLPPYERAKAHLVRHLKACNRCQVKKVQCSLDHHDISSLRPDPDPDLKVEPAEPPQPSLQLPSLRLEIPPNPSIVPGADMFEFNAMQNSSFDYMGSAPEFQDIGGSYEPQLDLHSAIEPGPFPSPIPNLQGSPNPFDPIIYDGETFSLEQVPNAVPLGQRNTITTQFGATQTYNCFNCQASFPDLEQCTRHFGTCHFPINLITPPLRLLCPGMQHLCRSFGDFQSCFCPSNGPMSVVIYGEMINTFSPNEQPSSAISNNGYNSSPNSGGNGFNQGFSQNPSPSWSSGQYNLSYGNNSFGGLSPGSSGGYEFSGVCSPHASASCEYHPSYESTDHPSSPSSRIRIIRQCTQKLSPILDHLKSHYHANPRRNFYIANDHWMVRYQPYFRAASIVCLTLSAMFFAFGNGDWILEKFTAFNGAILSNGPLFLGYAVFALCCFAVYWFVRHLWRRYDNGGERQHPTASHQCTLLKITIPLTRTVSRTSSPYSPYPVGGSFC